VGTKRTPTKGVKARLLVLVQAQEFAVEWNGGKRLSWL